MHTDVCSRAPEEACGIVAGKAGRVLKVYPATNALHSLVRYQLDPEEQLEIFNEIDQFGWELLGIYHSHPNGPNYPSATDIQEAYYPDSVYIIWAQSGGQWDYEGYHIRNGKFTEIPIFISS
jgi:proteasome lid subunit RPN8/RPN11